MKRMTTILISIMMYAQLAAPPSNSVAIFEAEGVNPFNDLWKATCHVESSGNRFAIGDNGKSYGIAQIQQSRLDDYYQRTGIRFELSDMFDVDNSREVFIYYCDNPYNLEAISRSWNGGNGWRHKKQTKDYWQKIQRRIKNRNHERQNL